MERVLLKYVLSYDEEGRKVEFDEEEEEEEEEGEVEIYGGEREGRKRPSRIKRRGCTRWKFSREREICLNALKSG